MHTSQPGEALLDDIDPRAMTMVDEAMSEDMTEA
jgi:hypothetical protein